MVELRLEPDNERDPDAVAVYNMDGIQMGYLSAERAPWIGAKIRNGVEIDVIFQEPARWGAVIRCAFDGEAAILPDPPTQKAPQDPTSQVSPESDEFWPDFMPPDE